MLFEEIKAADASGNSIKSAFDKVALATGRKPNSIRNYYYLKVRERNDHSQFVPFAQEEIDVLMRAMLTRQAGGRSVRGIAMELGKGDKKAMLRYQNKYRSMLRSNPEYVRTLMTELEAEGSAYVDPFYKKHKMKNYGVLSELAEQLERTEVDTEAFFGGLLALARAAVTQNPAADNCAQALLKELSAAKRENLNLRERYGTLRTINASFLKKDPSERISGIDEYVAEVQHILGEV